MSPARNAILLLVSLLALTGCQSCQDTGAPPPPPAGSAPQEQAPAAAPQQEAPAAAPEAAEEVDEDALVLLSEGEPDTGAAPLSVQFSVESLLDDAMKEPKYNWDFGDGSAPSSEASPVHVYEKPGSYTATIRIVDKDGLLGWDEVDVEVEEP